MVKYDDLVGIPYVSGGRDVRTGLDCWGLAVEIYRRQGLQLPPYPLDATSAAVTMAAFKSGLPQNWYRLGTPTPGCLVLIRFIGNPYGSHCGIYLGYGEFIHAYDTAVQIDKIRRWGPRVIGYYLPRKGVYPSV
ncbi:C40 family peptidase [Megasphaera vaginalis (ex Srinivasan et al. 2021)]|uniref:NlpC/P60 family protein n=1 Tax=Megasphaera vaginalis (ex Srinivasan et al. 2021) TaxID=1111454 RepID=U7UU11_9FIRM|nr:NlpC/P60 family protein [Megasphaera vaginalis (ex Srinivasan et al. 2021)]ERT62389.1 NlpC/P60 family protein [Megasphaera vaginalis (ex Srinivasan et al. 2021)]